MKKLLNLFLCLLSFGAAAPALAQADYYNQAQPIPQQVDYEKKSGWFLGSDQGVLFFVGDSGDFMGPQYYGSIFGGYNIQGYIAPMIRIAQTIGSARGFFDPTTFFFIMEGGVKITPLRTKFRPYFEGTAGFYVLDFSDLGFPIQDDVNFTFAAGGGIEYKFGASTIGIGSSYRGMINDGLNLRGVQVTLGYSFQF